MQTETLKNSSEKPGFFHQTHTRCMSIEYQLCNTLSNCLLFFFRYCSSDSHTHKQNYLSLSMPFKIPTQNNKTSECLCLFACDSSSVKTFHSTFQAKLFALRLSCEKPGLDMSRQTFCSEYASLACFFCPFVNSSHLGRFFLVCKRPNV